MNGKNEARKKGVEKEDEAEGVWRMKTEKEGAEECVRIRQEEDVREKDGGG